MEMNKRNAKSNNEQIENHVHASKYDLTVENKMMTN